MLAARISQVFLSDTASYLDGTAGLLYPSTYITRTSTDETSNQHVLHKPALLLSI